jgi:hypothetical protein
MRKNIRKQRKNHSERERERGERERELNRTLKYIFKRHERFCRKP